MVFIVTATEASLAESRLKPYAADSIIVQDSPQNAALDNDMFVVSVWHRLGHRPPADMAPPR